MSLASLPAEAYDDIGRGVFGGGPELWRRLDRRRLHEGKIMMGFRRLLAGATLLIAVLTFAVLAFAAPARAIELTGVWATDPGLCGKVFTKKANRVAFAELSDLYGSGFIIEASRIRGKIAKCTIKSRKEDGARVHLFAACSTSVAVENVEFDLKIVDDNTITRVTPGSTGMDVSYHRCTL